MAADVVIAVPSPFVDENELCDIVPLSVERVSFKNTLF